ncbi:MAG: hypothetical protein ABIP50_01630 [Candidatus Saccharimonadales bacterium]
MIIIFAVLAAALFVGAFLSRRRFGLLGLALTAGATVSGIWGYDAGLVVSSTGLVPEGPLTNAIALSLVVLLPAAILLFHGYTYKNALPRVIGALLFTMLALAFLVDPLGFVLPQDGWAGIVYRWFVDWKELIISVGVVFAVIDLFFTKPAKKEKDKRR